MNDMTTYYAPKVRLAALRLDIIKPDWWRNVNPLTLNLERDTDCVCGQNGLNWQADEIRGGEKKWNGVFSDRKAEPLWLEEIAKRMPAPVREWVES